VPQPGPDSATAKTLAMEHGGSITGMPVAGTVGELQGGARDAGGADGATSAGT
jgi:hypothetical protein